VNLLTRCLLLPSHTSKHCNPGSARTSIVGTSEHAVSPSRIFPVHGDRICSKYSSWESSFRDANVLLDICGGPGRFWKKYRSSGGRSPSGVGDLLVLEPLGLPRRFVGVSAANGRKISPNSKCYCIIVLIVLLKRLQCISSEAHLPFPIVLYFVMQEGVCTDRLAFFPLVCVLSRVDSDSRGMQRDYVHLVGGWDRQSCRLLPVRR
jgi:hypothetical protein